MSKILSILEQIKGDPEALLELDKAVKAQKAEIAEAKRAENAKIEQQRTEMIAKLQEALKPLKATFKSLNEEYQVSKVEFKISDNGEIDTIVKSPLLKRSSGSSGRPSVSFPRALENHGCSVEKGEMGYNIVSPDGRRFSKVTNVADLIRKEESLRSMLTDYEQSAL